MEKQVVSKKRVSDHGEVYTRKREVNAMLDLVKQETERIESRFLEPVASRSGHEHAGNPGTDGTRRVLAKTEILPPGTICTETYLVIGNYSTEQQARNLLAYMKTRFFRFLMSLFMYSHGITKDTFAFIPILDMTKQWIDKDIYERYGLTKDEITFIESKIRQMEADNG